jgi:hypothetical protein
MSFKEEFYNQLDEFASSPFLFIGSGFSFKYINTENWEGLLRKYSGMMKNPFERYRSLANGNWPKVGTLIAKDYHNHWFDSPDLEQERNLNLHEMVSFSSPLKVSVSTYIKEASEKPFAPEIQTDIELLKAAKINGIITTNYDLLCERIYPDFKVYKSQQELIFSSLQEIGEIYKIHGCCTEPNSLVITEEDYEDFNEKNAYLAAKLLTVFLEHPTIFMGYSISDKNVRSILSSIVKCLDQNQVNQLSNRLFFVEYVPDHKGEPTLDKFEFEMGGVILPLTRIRTKEYSEILSVLASLNQKFPAALLRKIKEHIYELVSTNDPTEKIAVVDFDTDTDLDKVDVVIGVGVSGKTEKSYETFSRFDIAEDILNNDKEFELPELINKTLPKLIKATTWIPICKYFSKYEDKENVDTKIKSAYNRDIEEWKNSNPYSYKTKSLRETYESIAGVIESNTPEKAVKIILLLEIDKIDLVVLEKFLKENFNLTQDPQHSSYFMKLVCLLDKLKYHK